MREEEERDREEEEEEEEEREREREREEREVGEGWPEGGDTTERGGGGRTNFPKNQ
jgi:hypothetical protein